MIPGIVKLVPASNLTELRPFQLLGEPVHPEVPWELLFELKLKIYVKIIYFEHFVFLGKFWLLMIFGTLLSKNVHFWAILTKTNICPNHQHI